MNDCNYSYTAIPWKTNGRLGGHSMENPWKVPWIFHGALPCICPVFQFHVMCCMRVWMAGCSYMEIPWKKRKAS